MSTGTHRKAASDDLHIPAVPWRYYVTGAILFALAVILAVSVSMLASPSAQAGTVSYLRPAVTAAQVFHKGHPRTWTAVLAHCKQAKDCRKVPAAIRHDLGIKDCQQARIEYGDTTYVWVRKGHNGVRTYNS